MNTVEKEFSPCGALCAECGQYGSDCSGCADIKGKVYWLEYTGQSVCAVYDCCVNNKKLKTAALARICLVTDLQKTLQSRTSRTQKTLKKWFQGLRVNKILSKF